MENANAEVHVNADWWNLLVAFRKEINSREIATKDVTFAAQEYVRRRTGEAQHAGEFMGLFRTPGAFAVKPGEQIHRLCFATDVKSGMVFCWLQADADTEKFWTEALEHLLFQELKFAPKHLVCPAIEAVVKEQLPKLKPGEAAGQVIPAFLLATASGVTIQPADDNSDQQFEDDFERAVLNFAAGYRRK